MPRKQKIAVIMGGRTPEHEISLISGREVVRSLNPAKYDVLPVIISKSGTSWKLVSPQELLTLPDPLTIKGTDKDLVVPHSQEISGPHKLSLTRVDIVFIAMHGPYGEDGTIQGMLELAGLRYTGSGVAASAIGMDKRLFRQLLKSDHLPFPQHIVFTPDDSPQIISQKLGPPPYFVKPHNQGSSVGTSLVTTPDQLSPALDLALSYSPIALVDEYISGKEITCALIGGSRPTPLPLVEIVPTREFFDYHSKYQDSSTQEIVPARISSALTKKIQQLTVRVYQLLGCNGFARVDFLLKNDRHPVILEINTIPGLTPMSLFPKAAAAAGISYPQLLDKILSYPTPA
jgi:D-alanine-D-alanine ligase